MVLVTVLTLPKWGNRHDPCAAQQGLSRCGRRVYDAHARGRRWKLSRPSYNYGGLLRRRAEDKQKRYPPCP